jgi:D-inositol-3-phosphate glycosyltransferase
MARTTELDFSASALRASFATETSCLNTLTSLQTKRAEGLGCFGQTLAVTMKLRIALLTAGRDGHYVFGLLRAFQEKPIHVEVIGDDAMAESSVVKSDQVDFYNLIGNQDVNTSLRQKVFRVLAYYARLVIYAARTDAKVFHILWFRKFAYIEGTLLNVYFKLLGKKLVFTAHNVDSQARNGNSTLTNRLSLRFLYYIVDHILVHTAKMKHELVEAFGIAGEKVIIVPFGINDVIPESKLTRAQAKEHFGFRFDEKILLFFGTIVPYKGVEDLISAMAALVSEDDRFRLIIAGPAWRKDGVSYWRRLEEMIEAHRLSDHVRKEVRLTYLADEDIGVFFKAADVVVLPYRSIYQSGVLPLSYKQGLPVIAADVGSLKEDIIEGQTGLVFRAGNAADLVAKIRLYFASDLYRELETRGRTIREYGDERFSWAKNVDRTCAVYENLMKNS